MKKQLRPCTKSFAIGVWWQQALWKYGVQIAIFGILATVGAQRANAQSYTVTQLDNSGIALAINAGGQVCIETVPSRTPSSLLWTPAMPNSTTGALQLLLPLKAPQLYLATSYTTAINSSDTVVGYTSFVRIKNYAGTYPFYDVATVWQNGQPVALPGGSSDSCAYGINSAGDIVGEVDGIAALWHNGAVTLLSTPKKSQSTAYGINDAGQIVGSITDKAGVDHATLWQNGNAFDLGVFNAVSGEGVANAINNAGVITGFAATLDPTGATIQHAFVWTPTKQNGTKGSMIDVTPNPGFQVSGASGINSSGQIVGGYTMANGQSGGFFWDRVHGLRDLNTLLPTGSVWSLSAAYGINDHGQIVGTGNLGAFLLTP